MTFTTERKEAIRRGCNTIRSRCLQYIEVLRRLGFQKEIELTQAKRIFSQSLGIFDRASLKAYFGSQAARSIRKIQRVARYSSGTMSFKTIELAQEIPKTKGYLEVLGLASFELRGKNWMMVLRNPFLVPQLLKGDGSKDNFSLSSNQVSLGFEGNGEPALEEQGGEGAPPVKTHKQTTTYRVRERNRSSESESDEVLNDSGSFVLDLAQETRALLKGKPCWEIDRALVRSPE
jgi:hypothetical protein